MAGKKQAGPRAKRATKGHTRPIMKSTGKVKRGHRQRPEDFVAYSPKFVKLFIETLKNTYNVAHACVVTNISRTRAYRLRRQHTDFAKLWDEAVETTIDKLEACALDRAMNGWDEPVFYRGKSIGTKRVYSPGLTIFMLKCNRPDKYNIEHEGRGGLSGEEQAEAARKFLQEADQSMQDADPKGGKK